MGSWKNKKKSDDVFSLMGRMCESYNNGEKNALTVKSNHLLHLHVSPMP